MINKAFEKQKGKGITSTEQARKLGSLGGKASQRVQKKNKMFKELILEILSQPATSKMCQQIQKSFEIKGQDLTLREAMVYAQAIKAIYRQDTKAFEVLRDTVGEKPTEKIETTEKKFDVVEIVDGEEVIELK